MTRSKASTFTFAALGFLIVAAAATWSQNQPAKRSPIKPAAAGRSANAAAPPATSAPAPTVKPASKRDPFNPLITEHKTGGGEHLPPGKAGLVVATVRVDGTVRSGDSMIAVLSNPEEHVYFVREGDRLYDGDVEKIALDGVTFRENSKDAFGKPVERVVTKRIYASAGEQQ